MEIRAAEISSILKDQIANFGAEADVAEVGQVPRRHQGHGPQPRNRQRRRGYFR